VDRTCGSSLVQCRGGITVCELLHPGIAIGIADEGEKYREQGVHHVDSAGSSSATDAHKDAMKMVGSRTTETDGETDTDMLVTPDDLRTDGWYMTRCRYA